MGIFDRFPYSSTHEMNLDFMLGKATEIAEDMQQVTAGMEQVQAGLTAISEKTEQATQAAAQAAQSASSIEGSVTAAEEAAEEAQMHNESAQTWANNAMTYKADCQRSATEAAASSSSAAQAATAAAASEDTVAQYAQAANASAQSAANNNDSAHQYANQASASASNATFHSSNAQTAATNANTSATNAETAATNAQTAATRTAALKDDCETLHRMCAAAVDLAAEQAIAAGNSAGQAAATKTDVETLVESLPEDFTDLNNTVNKLSDEKVNKPVSSPNGTSGQLLRTNGDGTTTWVDQGLPTDAQTATAVAAWLNAHPEATTTVADGSITADKISGTFMPYITAATLVSTLAELSDAFSAGKSVIILKNGTNFEVSSQISVPENTYIIGYGATIKRAVGYDGLLIRLANHCSIYGLNIDGNRLNTVSPSWDTTTEIRIIGNNCLIENVIIQNGNEVIVVYGNDVTIKGCILTNCGGNGIHFSGAKRTRVENCTIIGANKKSGMGHEDGCIIWSNACEHQVCVNNWCEDGRSGFGSIDSVDNANIKIIGNTVKGCTYAVEAMYASLQPSNVEITNNQFINSGSLVIRRVADSSDDGATPAMVNVLIANNIFNNTNIDCRYLKRLNIENNIVDLGNINAIKCPDCVIKGNTVETNDNIGIGLDTSFNAIVSGNSVIANLNAIYAGDSKGAVIMGNSLRVRILGTNNYPNSPCIATNGAVGIIITNNTMLSLYGLYLYAESIVTNNIVKCRLSGETAVGAGSGISGNVKDNIVYGNFRPEQGENLNVDGNITGSVPNTYSVACALTNIEPVSVDAVWAQDSLLVQLVASNGYVLPDTITVAVGGKTLPLITQGDYVNVPNGYTYDKNTGIVRIPSVLNYVNITATGVSA